GGGHESPGLDRLRDLGVAYVDDVGTASADALDLARVDVDPGGVEAGARELERERQPHVAEADDAAAGLAAANPVDQGLHGEPPECVADDRGRWGGGGDPGAPARAPTADADLTERRKRRPRRSRRGRLRLPTCARAQTSQVLRGRREPGAAHRRALEARPVARRSAPTPC